MTQDEIMAEWEQDCKIDPVELANESRRSTELHSKYLRIYLSEKSKLNILRAQFKRLYKQKWEFYTQGGTKEIWQKRKEEWENKGWELPDRGSVIKSDAPIYLESDKEMLILQVKVDNQADIVEGIKWILGQIDKRGYAIRAAIDWHKFTAGG